MNPNDPLDDSLEESEARFVSEKSEARQERWEGRVVKRLVQSHVGASAAVSILRAMKEEVGERTDMPRLTFDGFIAAFPKFPVWIVSRPIPFAHSHVDYGEFQSKHEHWFSLIYREAVLNISDDWGDRPVGIVFEMLNKHAQFNILHNHFVEAPGVKGATIRIVDPKNLPGPIYLEPLDFFLYSIGWFGTGE